MRKSSAEYTGSRGESKGRESEKRDGGTRRREILISYPGCVSFEDSEESSNENRVGEPDSKEVPVKLTRIIIEHIYYHDTPLTPSPERGMTEVEYRGYLN
ncbi:MAG: hypothetical protein J4G05_03115 [Chlorobi bacterium]|nr:hypothetical protein [Chlorobiota bacterium]